MDNKQVMARIEELLKEKHLTLNALKENKTSAILKNSQYTFIFKLSAPDMKDVLDVYQAGESFNEEEQRMIISAGTGQALFIGSTELRTCIKIKAGEYTKSLFEVRTAEEYKENA